MQFTKTINIQLSNEDPVFAVNLADLPESFIISVNSPPVDILELFVVGDELPISLLDKYLVYDGDESIGTLKDAQDVSSIIPKRFTSKTGTLSVFTKSGMQTPVTLFFRGRIAHSTGCTTQETVIQPPSTLYSISFTAESLCGYTFVNYGKAAQKMRVSGINQSPDSSIVNFFSPEFNKNVQYFNITHADAALWNDIVLRGLYNTLFMSHSTISMNIQYGDGNPPSIKYLKGIMYSDNYGKPDVSIKDSVIYILGTIYNTAKLEIEFTCIELDNDDLQLSQNGKSYR